MFCEAMFDSTFFLPTEGLFDFSQVSSFVLSQMKVKFSIFTMSSILLVKADSLDAITSEKLLVMTAITFGVKINWSTVMFIVLMDMISIHAIGFVVNINKMFMVLKALVSSTRYCTQKKMLDAIKVIVLRPKIPIIPAATIKKSW